jgi:hypothetical protein
VVASLITKDYQESRLAMVVVEKICVCAYNSLPGCSDVHAYNSFPGCSGLLAVECVRPKMNGNWDGSFQLEHLHVF